MDYRVKNPLRDHAFWAAIIPLLLLFAPEQVYERASSSPELIVPIIAWIGGNTALRRKAIDATVHSGGE